MKTHSYAVSDGEGTLLEFGSIDFNDEDFLIHEDDEHRMNATIIIGPYDGTGE